MPNTNYTQSGFITAYCSHSYRENDIPVNLYFWEFFCEQGIMFSVDPKSNFFSIPYLEKMMQNSSCFVAIIPFRQEQNDTRCSPHILFEKKIAMYQHKPRLLLLEDRISKKYFHTSDDDIIVFNRYNLRSKEEKLRFSISELVKKARGNYNAEARLHSKVLFISDNSTSMNKIYTKKVLKLIEDELVDLGYELKVYQPVFDHDGEFCHELDSTDFILIEQRTDLVSPWITAFVHARAIPSIRLCYNGDSPTITDNLFIPPLLKYSNFIHESVQQSLIMWDKPATLIDLILPHLNKLDIQRVILTEKQVGERYFKSIGREDTLVFISFADEIRELAIRLSNALRTENINFFQYKERDAIKVGDKWEKTLKEKLEKSKIFVALIDSNYLNKEWCDYEMKIARTLESEGKMRIIPYHLLKKIPTKLNDIQGREVHDWDYDKIVTTIVEDVDNALRQKSQDNE